MSSDTTPRSRRPSKLEVLKWCRVQLDIVVVRRKIPGLVGEINFSYMHFGKARGYTMEGADWQREFLLHIFSLF